MKKIYFLLLLVSFQIQKASACECLNPPQHVYGTLLAMLADNDFIFPDTEYILKFVVIGDLPDVKGKLIKVLYQYDHNPRIPDTLTFRNGGFDDCAARMPNSKDTLVGLMNMLSGNVAGHLPAYQPGEMKADLCGRQFMTVKNDSLYGWISDSSALYKGIPLSDFQASLDDIFKNPPLDAIDKISLAEQALKIFPNPADNLINIVSDAAEIADACIYNNATGDQVLCQRGVNQYHFTMDISSLLSGEFVIRAITKNGIELQQQFTKK